MNQRISRHFLRFHFVVLVLVVSAAANLHSAEPILLRVLSYNIHHCEGVDGKLDLNRIANVIRESKADLVALQEVDQDVRRSENVKQAEVLAERLGMNVEFGDNIQLQGGKYGNAILSRFPILESKNHLLPSLNNGEQRGVLVTRIQLPPHKQTFAFLATHFDHRRDESERLQSVEFVNRLATNLGPAILAGDLNAIRLSQTIRLLASEWKHSSEATQPTVPVSKPVRQIDFVMYRPQQAWRVVETKILKEAIASDHRAVLAVFELQLEQ